MYSSWRASGAAWAGISSHVRRVFQRRAGLQRLDHRVVDQVQRILPVFHVSIRNAVKSLLIGLDQRNQFLYRIHRFSLSV